MGSTADRSESSARELSCVPMVHQQYGLHTIASRCNTPIRAGTEWHRRRERGAHIWGRLVLELCKRPQQARKVWRRNGVSREQQHHPLHYCPEQHAIGMIKLGHRPDQIAQLCSVQARHGIEGEMAEGSGGRGIMETECGECPGDAG
jgi:hypothetical protein